MSTTSLTPSGIKIRGCQGTYDIAWTSEIILSKFLIKSKARRGKLHRLVAMSCSKRVVRTLWHTMPGLVQKIRWESLLSTISLIYRSGQVGTMRRSILITWGRSNCKKLAWRLSTKHGRIPRRDQSPEVWTSWAKVETMAFQTWFLDILNFQMIRRSTWWGPKLEVHLCHHLQITGPIEASTQSPKIDLKMFIVHPLSKLITNMIRWKPPNKMRWSLPELRGVQSKLWRSWAHSLCLVLKGLSRRELMQMEPLNLKETLIRRRMALF